MPLPIGKTCATCAYLQLNTYAPSNVRAKMVCMVNPPGLRDPMTPHENPDLPHYGFFPGIPVPEQATCSFWSDKFQK